MRWNYTHHTRVAILPAKRCGSHQTVIQDDECASMLVGGMGYTPAHFGYYVHGEDYEGDTILSKLFEDASVVSKSLA